MSEDQLLDHEGMSIFRFADGAAVTGLRFLPVFSLLYLFSFQEMAEYDIPAMLEHALKVSGQSQLFYIGHSQGTLIGFSEFSANPELAKKVKLFIALAPIFYLSHTAAILRDLAFTLKPIEV